MIFLKLLPDVQSDIHLVQRNIVLKLYGSFEHLKDSFHNKNDSPWCVCFFFFFIFSFERLHKYFIFKEAFTNITNFCLVLLCFCFVLLLFRFIFSLSQLFVFLLLFVFGFFIWSYFCTTLMRNIFLLYSVSQPAHSSDCKW